MDADRWRQRVDPHVPRKPCPRPRPTIRSPIEPVAPAPLDLVHKTAQRVRVPGDPVIPVVPLQLLRELPVLFAYWRMAMLAAPPSDAGDRPAKTIRGRLLLDHPVPTPRLRPVIGEAQQIKCSPARPFGWSLRVAPSRRAEVDQSGLFWVQGQAVLAESLRQHRQHPTRISLFTEAQNRIVRVANQDRSACKPWLDVLLEPHVQDFVQKDVRQQW